LFDDAIYEIAEDDADELFYSKNSCTSHDCRIGEYHFCEAIKVDLAESGDKQQKNQTQKNKNQLSSTLSSTVYLLCTLFEDLGCAIEFHEKLVNEVTALHCLYPRNYLFNGQEEGDYLFGGKEFSMKPVVMTRNIDSCMYCGVCLPTERSTKICL
jgi:hypothetical protein